MRTRFLNIDFFNHNTSDVNFPHLPDPYINDDPSPSNPLDLEQFLRFDSIPNDCSQIQDLPIENALSSFLSDVLPQHIDISEDDFRFLYSSESETAEIRSDEDEEKTSARRCTRKGSSDAMQFETPELDLLEEPCNALRQQENKIFFDIQEIEVPASSSLLDSQICEQGKNAMHHFGYESRLGSQDMNLESLADTIPYPHTASELVYSVQKIAPEYSVEEKSSFSVEYDSLIHEKSCHSPLKYPLLEVNETGLECCTDPSTIDEIDLLFEKIECQQWSQIDTAIDDGQELLGSSEIDILECLSELSSEKQCFDIEPTAFNLMIEVDFVCLRETGPLQGNSSIHPEALDFSFAVTSLIQFEDHEILDMDCVPSFEVLFGSQTANDLKSCDQMFGENNSIQDFYESFVSHELALDDETFSSLPIPVVYDAIEIWSVSEVLQEILAQLKPYPPSASDVIYLDWHLLQESRCDNDTCSSYWNLLEDIDICISGPELMPVNGMMIIDFALDDEPSGVSNTFESKELWNELTFDSPSRFLKHKGTHIVEINEEIPPTSFKSMLQFNSLDFFLNSRKVSLSRNGEPSAKEISDTEANLRRSSSNNATAVCASAEMKPLKWDIEVHKVQLSNSILRLIDNFRKCYLEILESDTNMSKRHCSLPVIDSLKLLSLPKQSLMDWIENTRTQNITLPQKDKISVALVELYAIKQLAYHLCFYGIHATHLFVDSLFGRFRCLRLKLSFIQSLIEDDHKKADIDITASHPSLSAFQKLLKSEVSQNGSRVLIVADRIFWSPLKRLLTSLRISFDGLPDSQSNQTQQDVCINWTLGALLHNDCLLLTHEHVSASFPFNKFSIVLEYGGSYRSSRLSSTAKNLVTYPRLHFLVVELEDLSVPKALCEGVDVSQNALEGISQLMCNLNEEIKEQNIDELLNFVPAEQNSKSMESLNSVGAVEACSVPVSVSTNPSAMESKPIHSRTRTSPQIIIIMNTQNCDKEMLISRRSSYQKILSMEKGGVQVVEREMSLPVDLILSASMCLIWYNCVNIWKKSATADDTSSSIPLCIENIATNILMALSFAFSSCVLIFEGETRFLATIMETSDGLYAAAASLGVDLQLFCSCSAELTDEIIMNCVDYVIMSESRLYPELSESETLAEAFLTRFPSVNPLSAHAILSSGETLADFLELSHDRRIQAIGKYHVSGESMALFSALCRHGEQEESKSGTTDCSSVSSAPGSRNSRSKIQSQRKKQKCVTSPRVDNFSIDDCFILEPLLNQPIENKLKMSNVSHDSQPYQPRVFPRNHGTLHDTQGFDFALDNKFLDKRRSLDTPVIQNLIRADINGSKSFYNGEVIDLDETFCTADNSSFGKQEKGKNYAYGNSLSERILSFGSDKYTDFPSIEEINSGTWNWAKDQDRRLENIFHRTHIDTGKEDTLSLKTRGELLKKTMQESALRQVSEQNVASPYDKMPLSKLIRSSGTQQESPWTNEFLNKVKEKTRMHQESLVSNNLATLYGYYGNKMENTTKRKSPSTIDLYKYQGGSSSKKPLKRKSQRQFIPPPSASRKEKVPASLSQMQTWTPLDKRARQTLSFARKGNGNQSKLVWSDDSIPTPRKRFRN